MGELRSGRHGHGSSDGNFAHVTALYEILAAIRQRPPDLLIENCSQGGNRLDFGMLRYTDTAWMDDRTAPSVHVRHNIEGLSEIFPPGYLLSFVTDYAGESIENAPDLSLYFRSRMAGILGLCFRGGELSDDDAERIRREIAIYKSVRETQSDGSAALLVPGQLRGRPAWDVLLRRPPMARSCSMPSRTVARGGQHERGQEDLQAGVTVSFVLADVGDLGEATEPI